MTTKSTLFTSDPVVKWVPSEDGESLTDEIPACRYNYFLTPQPGDFDISRVEVVSAAAARMSVSRWAESAAGIVPASNVRFNSDVLWHIPFGASHIITQAHWPFPGFPWPLPVSAWERCEAVAFVVSQWLEEDPSPDYASLLRRIPAWDVVMSDLADYGAYFDRYVDWRDAFGDRPLGREAVDYACGSHWKSDDWDFELHVPSLALEWNGIPATESTERFAVASCLNNAGIPVAWDDVLPARGVLLTAICTVPYDPATFAREDLTIHEKMSESATVPGVPNGGVRVVVEAETEWAGDALDKIPKVARRYRDWWKSFSFTNVARFDDRTVPRTVGNAQYARWVFSAQEEAEANNGLLPRSYLNHWIREEQKRLRRESLLVTGDPDLAGDGRMLSAEPRVIRERLLQMLRKAGITVEAGKRGRPNARKPVDK